MAFRPNLFFALAAALALSVASAAAQDFNPPLPAEAPPPVLSPPAAPAAPAPMSAPAATPAPALATTPAQATPAPIVAPGPEQAAPVPIPTAPATGPSAAPRQAGAPEKKPARRVVRLARPRENALSTDPEPTFQSETFFATAKASERYAKIADAGGWPRVPRSLGPDAHGPAVALLRRRLAIEGDAQAGAAPDPERWDASLTAAVKRFQGRLGLRETGLVAGATLKELNVPASERFRQLASSAQRIAGVNFPFGERYVVVNIPSLSVEAVEHGRVAHRYLAIVGGVDHQSPEISARIQAINLNPTWTVPVSIIKKEIIPRMRRDPGYLSREKIRILDGSGDAIDPKSVNWNTQRAASYTLRQDSGVHNSLGLIRIGMPNKLAVYMHDTPAKGLFGADYRFLSHGCVRVQGVYDLAAWLLEGTQGGPAGGWTVSALRDRIKLGAREDIRLAKATPVIWVYLTGWSNGDGPAHFRDDVYGIDNVGDATASVAGQASAPAQ